MMPNGFIYYICLATNTTSQGYHVEIASLHLRLCFPASSRSPFQRHNLLAEHWGKPWYFTENYGQIAATVGTNIGKQLSNIKGKSIIIYHGISWPFISCSLQMVLTGDFSGIIHSIHGVLLVQIPGIYFGP